MSTSVLCIYGTRNNSIAFLGIVIVLYFTAEAPTCFDSYNQPSLGGGRLFEHAAIEPWKRPPKSIGTLLTVAVLYKQLTDLITKELVLFFSDSALSRSI